MISRIAVLCSDGPHHRYLTNRLAASVEVGLVVVEPGVAQLRRRCRFRRFGTYLAWQYHAVRRRWMGLDDYRRRYFATEAGVRVGRRVTVAWINDQSVSRVLRAFAPDITVVMGTSILRPETLNAAGSTIINIHGGFLPWYRGNHCFFRAMLERDRERVGSTIHHVTTGVDSGDVIERVVVPFSDNEHPEIVYCRAEKRAIDRVAELLQELQQGATLERQQQEDVGRTYRMSDRLPHHELVYWLRRSGPSAPPWLWGRDVGSAV